MKVKRQLLFLSFFFPLMTLTLFAGTQGDEVYRQLKFEEQFMIETFPDKKEEAKQRREAKKRLKSVGRRARREVHFSRLKNLMKCASTLVEDQIGGSESSLLGLGIFQALREKLKGEDYEYRFLEKRCGKILWNYKKRMMKKEVRRKKLGEDEKKRYLAEVALRFPDSPHILTLARQAVNPKLVCRRAFGFHFEIGVVGATGFGGDHYSCWSPLGRKIHLSGPTVSGGVGAGASLSVGGSREYNVITEFHDLSNLKVTQSEIRSVIGGYSKIEGNNDSSKETQIKLFPEKKHDLRSREGVLGGGWIKVVRRTALAHSVGVRQHFKESGLFDLLGVPVQVHF